LFNYNDYTEIIMVLPLMKRFITFQADDGIHWGSD